MWNAATCSVASGGGRLRFVEAIVIGGIGLLRLAFHRRFHRERSSRCPRSSRPLAWLAEAAVVLWPCQKTAFSNVYVDHAHSLNSCTNQKQQSVEPART